MFVVDTKQKTKIVIVLNKVSLALQKNKIEKIKALAIETIWHNILFAF